MVFVTSIGFQSIYYHGTLCDRFLVMMPNDNSTMLTAPVNQALEVELGLAGPSGQVSSVMVHAIPEH